MPKLRYEGHVANIQVYGFGHFNHGDEKDVDFLTAAGFKEPSCAAEGWVVVDDAPVVPKHVKVVAKDERKP